MDALGRVGIDPRIVRARGGGGVDGSAARARFNLARVRELERSSARQKL